MASRKTPKTNAKIQALLDSAFEEFHSLPHRNQDPIQMVHRYPDPSDQEVVALLAALLSYGNVRSILTSIHRVLGPLGKSPRSRILAGGFEKLWPDFVHRFTREEDIEVVCSWIQSALLSHGSLEAFFVDQERGMPMKSQLSSFVRRFRDQPLPESLRKAAKKRERNLKYLLSDPEQGSACKRLNMFLRWVVRQNDGIDLGLWKSVSASELILPIDTHLLQTLQRLRWTKSKQATWKVAEEATDRLRLYCTEDPVRYDFSLCHLSMTRGSNAA